MKKIDIKPLSVNAAWKGRRFKTDSYKAYEKAVLLMLPKLNVPKGIELELIINAGFSSKSSDLDNCAKPFIDILQKKFGFNDNQIYKLTMTKQIVPKGYEFISYKIQKYDHTLDFPLF